MRKMGQRFCDVSLWLYVSFFPFSTWHPPPLKEEGGGLLLFTDNNARLTSPYPASSYNNYTPSSNVDLLFLFPLILFPTVAVQTSNPSRQTETYYPNLSRGGSNLDLT